ncbi:Hypothetical predicted protein, partial [Marmota monax]
DMELGGIPRLWSIFAFKAVRKIHAKCPDASCAALSFTWELTVYKASSTLTGDLSTIIQFSTRPHINRTM